jgi:glycosyltransferase involved in cell wall biosynthesis
MSIIGPVILFLHHHYRTSGGEERAVEDLLWLVREQLGEDAELLERESGTLGQSAAATGLLRGGLDPDEVARAVKRTGARIVHAHNLHPTFGWRALAAARAAGARVVMHLHQYRLVCATGVCFTRGAECTRCHGRNTLPGIALNCRGSRLEAVVYGAGLMLWQRRLTSLIDAFIVPSHFAEQRLRALGAPIGLTFVLPHIIRDFAAGAVAKPEGHALLASRLVPEKGVDIAIEACRMAGVPLVVAGDGPERRRLDRGGERVRFVGRVEQPELATLRSGAALALCPSRSAETFGLAAAEAMAAGLPVAASRVGGLPELVPDEWLVPPGDAGALAAAITRLRRDPAAGGQAIERARAVTAPGTVGPVLAQIYARACAR